MQHAAAQFHGRAEDDGRPRAASRSGAELLLKRWVGDGEQGQVDRPGQVVRHLSAYFSSSSRCGSVFQVAGTHWVNRDMMW
jgi:hypothetical protein